ncbi:MAG: hypothetical protein WBG41_16690, partial [Acidimicrobiales bacterium]
VAVLEADAVAATFEQAVSTSARMATAGIAAMRRRWLDGFVMVTQRGYVFGAQGGARPERR